MIQKIVSWFKEVYCSVPNNEDVYEAIIEIEETNPTFH